MDWDTRRLVIVICIAMILTLLLVTEIKVVPFNVVEQENTIFFGDGTSATTFVHPACLPTSTAYSGSGPMRIMTDEWMQISPYDNSDGTSYWSYNGTPGSRGAAGLARGCPGRRRRGIQGLPDQAVAPVPAKPALGLHPRGDAGSPTRTSSRPMTA